MAALAAILTAGSAAAQPVPPADTPPAAAPSAAAPAAAPPAALPDVSPPPAAPPAPAPAAAASPNPPAQTTNDTEPFAWGDFTWLNGNSRQTKAPLDTPYFTPEILIDVNYTASLNNPIDDTVVGSTALSRNNEFTLAFMGFGGDFHYDNARGRIMTQFGVRSTLVPRNDFSTTRGQFDLQTALRYVSEAYGGYHLPYMHGINIDAGIFMSYVGLFSYDNYENWMYLPSFTSDNTPWFFNGVRVQTFPTDRLKVELWLINGWQTYAKFNTLPGFGTQILYRPIEAISIVSNDYIGWDTQDQPGRTRFHSDNSFQLRWWNDSDRGMPFMRAAFSITADIGGEWGGGPGAAVTPFGGSGKEGGCNPGTPCTQHFLSAMAYQRFWFSKQFAWTLGGGYMNNPGRYLVLAPTGNASPNGLPQPLGVPPASQPFDLSPGTTFNAWDYETGFQYMPNEQFTFDCEFNHRQADVPYFAGHGGVTSPDGFYTTATPPGWRPDLVKADTRIIFAALTRF
ncbi:MAG TPA: outer membrane beta-barrel protein [Polyangia bacterium]|nr:outer membrane beta-barrel protein [Polyangia bacterium]